MSVNASYHSIMRYIERFRPDMYKQALNEIKQIVANGVEVEYQDNAVKLMNNGYKQSKYYLAGDKVAVVSLDGTVRTVLDIKNDRKRWIIPKHAAQHKK